MKKSIEPMPFVGAMPVVIVAVKDGEKINFAPHGMYGQLCHEPPLIHISALKGHMTARIISKTNKFSINIANCELLDKIKYCSSVSGVEKDKSGEFDVFYGKDDVPMVSDCPVNLCCEVIDTIDTKYMTVFIGKVTEAFSDEECMIDGSPAAAKMDPIICTIQGTFHKLGDEV